LSSAKYQSIYSIFAGIDDDDPSCCGSLAKLVEWYRPEEIVELGKHPDPFHEPFPQANQMTPFFPNLLSTTLITIDIIFTDGEERVREISSIKLLTNFLKLCC